MNPHANTHPKMKLRPIILKSLSPQMMIGGLQQRIYVFVLIDLA